MRYTLGSSALPQIESVYGMLADPQAETQQVRQFYVQELEQLRRLAQPVAYVQRVSGGQLPQSCASLHEEELLAVLITLGAAGEEYVRELFARGEHLRAVVFDAMLNAQLFCADDRLQEQLRESCRQTGCGVRERLEPVTQLPEEMSTWICEQLKAEHMGAVTVSSTTMLYPQKTMCYLLVLSTDVGQFAAAHDCSSCARTDCPLRRVRQPQSKKPVTILVENLGKKVIGEQGQSLLAMLQDAKLPIAADCGGSGACGKCRIQLVGGSLPVTASDAQCLSKKELDNGMRLACCAYPSGQLRIRLPMERREKRETVRVQPAAAEKDPAGYGIAVDIGTTTLAAAIYGCSDGAVSASGHVSAYNSGRVFGADVLSRIEASNRGASGQLQELLQKDLRELCARSCAQAGVTPDAVRQMVFAGNLTMVHLLMGYSCETLGRAPFVPVNSGLIRSDAAQLLGAASYDCPVTLLPAVSAFVGGDIVAGMLLLGMDEIADDPARTMLLLDVGTNGEMALAHRGVIYVTSAAAGPAFEGAGVYGSLVLEVMRELLCSGRLSATGLLAEPYRTNGYAFAETAGGSLHTFTQEHVRGVQLAKAAIRTGIDALLAAGGLQAQQVTEIVLAGSFGEHMDTEAAICVGLLPKEFRGRIRAAGNTSLAGAVYAGRLEGLRERCERLTRRCKTIGLTGLLEFQEKYVKYMDFEVEA